MPAALRIESLAFAAGGVDVSFSGDWGHSYYLESSRGQESAWNWQRVAGPLVGGTDLQTLRDPTPPTSRAFYRISCE